MRTVIPYSHLDSAYPVHGIIIGIEIHAYTRALEYRQRHPTHTGTGTHVMHAATGYSYTGTGTQVHCVYPRHGWMVSWIQDPRKQVLLAGSPDKPCHLLHVVGALVLVLALASMLQDFELRFVAGDVTGMRVLNATM